jgi:hypothetical protein
MCPSLAIHPDEWGIGVQGGPEEARSSALQISVLPGEVSRKEAGEALGLNRLEVEQGLGDFIVS